MKGVIIIPKFYEKECPRPWLLGSKNASVWAPLFYGISEQFGFNLVFADEVNVPNNTDVVIMFGVPYHNRTKLIPGLLDLNKNIKLIMFTGDLQCYNNKLCLDNKIKVFERCDVIISITHEYFVKMYPQFLSKHEFMPHFFSPYDRYSKISFNNNPKMLCLLSGSLNPEVYPLRTFVKKSSQYVDYPQPNYIGDSYAKLLHSYFCCVTDPTIFNYIVAKYFEVLACGSLLIAKRCNDLDRVGFIPFRHYIPVTMDNVTATIAQCLENPDDYTHIRKEGMDFVRKNHSVINRIDQFEKILSNTFK